MTNSIDAFFQRHELLAFLAWCAVILMCGLMEGVL